MIYLGEDFITTFLYLYLSLKNFSWPPLLIWKHTFSGHKGNRNSTFWHEFKQLFLDPYDFYKKVKKTWGFYKLLSWKTECIIRRWEWYYFCCLLSANCFLLFYPLKILTVTFHAGAVILILYMKKQIQNSHTATESGF